MIALHLSGDGRMGRAIRRLVDEEGAGVVAGDVAAADVVIDFSHPDWTGPLVKRLLEDPRPLVLGTTGLSAAIRADLDALAERAPVLVAANTSSGVTALRALVQSAVSMLPGWDIEVVEMHHRRKVDAPSGTAWMLLEAAEAAREQPPEGVGHRTLRRHAVPSRVGETGARTDEEIGIQTLRGGDVVGEHTVYLVGHGERVELTHRCWDRDTFARGALRAATWLVGREPGTYTMSDVLGA